MIDILKGLLILIAQLVVGPALFIAMGALIGAVLLRAAAWWVAGLDVSYRTAFVTVFLAGMASYAVGLPIAILIRLMVPSTLELFVGCILLSPVGFLVQSWVIGARHKVKYKTACLISLIMFAIGLGIVAAVAAIVSAIIWMASISAR
ncbi:MAG: hypothetical protein NTW86_19515 [Candidatus Sumerlaeota bacterium]|nr:hypothetical protein [Candidatus Sumerlaeota bacterium]